MTQEIRVKSKRRKPCAQGRAYTWRDWSLARGRDCLYIWSDAAALELSNGSNGWFRFILDGKLATMYSSGSPEGGSDSSENRGEFLEKLQRARAAVTASAIDAAAVAAAGSGTAATTASAAAAMAATAAASAAVAAPVFTKKSPDVIAVGNWNLSCSQGSVQQSRLSSQFGIQCCNFATVEHLQKGTNFPFHRPFEVFKMGLKWGMSVHFI